MSSAKRSIRRSLGFVFPLLALLLVVAAFLDLQSTVRAWYFGAYSGLHLALGCLVLLLIGDLTGGRWVERLEPRLNAGRQLIPWMLLAFALPQIRLDLIFPWTGHAIDLQQPFPLSKEAYLSPPFYMLRALFYALSFILLWLGGNRVAQNIRLRRSGARRPSRPFSGPALVLFAFTNLFFQVDAIMSIEPDWFSTGFPVVMMASQAFAAYSLCLAFQTLRTSPETRAEPFFGNLLLTMMVFWLYVTFVQFLIIWMGNLSEDILYYLHRSEGVWFAITIYLALFSFALPFLLLIHTRTKTDPHRLGFIAGLLLFGQLLYLAWAILPSWTPMGWSQGLLVALAASAFLGLAAWHLLDPPELEVKHD